MSGGSTVLKRGETFALTKMASSHSNTCVPNMERWLIIFALSHRTWQDRENKSSRKVESEYLALPPFLRDAKYPITNDGDDVTEGTSGHGDMFAAGRQTDIFSIFDLSCARNPLRALSPQVFGFMPFARGVGNRHWSRRRPRSSLIRRRPLKSPCACALSSDHSALDGTRIWI